MTVQQLRQALFELENQQMTIKELRMKLFDVENQHQPVTLGKNMWVELGIDKSGRA